MIRDSQAAVQKPDSCIPSIESLMLGLLAALVVQTFRAGSTQFIWWVRLEACFELLIPVVLLFAWYRFVNKDLALGDATKWKYLLQIGAFIYAGLPVLLQLVSRSLFGVGDPNEIVALLVLQNAAWYLVVFSAFWNFGRVGFLFSSALVLFVCFTSDKWPVLAMALLFSLIAMWWLMGNYWSRLETKLLDGKSKSLPIRWSFLAGTALIVAAVGLTASSNKPIMQTISAAGFMPTSGGSKWSDDYANSGIGDGDMLAAGEDATTTGAVDSNQFIEDNRRSIYDAINELFEDPVPRIEKKRNRAQTISESTTHIHDVKRSEQSGQSFRVVRKPGRNRKKRQFEDVISDALFFVEGSVPVRFQIDTFNNFDGWDWSHREYDWEERLNLGIRVKELGSKPWYVIQSQTRRYLPSSRHHRVKIMRLQSSSLPSSPFLQRWHIAKVNSENMFSWGDNGLVNFDGQIPPQTMIDMVGNVPNYHVLRSSNNFTNSFTADSDGIFNWLDRKLGIVHHMHMSQGSKLKTHRDSDSQFVQVASEKSKLRLRQLADEWVAGIEPGWNQIEEIVSRFRTDFVVDPANVAPEDCENAIDHFLDQQSGPGYLFATTMAQMLRAAGYRTRLARGYLVQQDDFIRKAGQSVVTSENVHVWPEVCLDNCHWIPLEPTPGFPIPFSTETFFQFLSRKFYETIGWAIANPISVAIILSLVVLLVRTRRQIFARICWLLWALGFRLSTRHRLKITRQLIDARFRAAGIGRPKFALVADWFRQVDPGAGRNFFNYWQAANFSNHQPDMTSDAVAKACKQLVAELTYKRINQYKNEKTATSELSPTEVTTGPND